MASQDAALPRAAMRPALVPAVRGPAVVLAAVGAVLWIVPAVLFAGDTGPSRLDVRVQNLVGDSPAGAWNLVRAMDWLGEPAGRVVLVLATAALCLIAGRQALAVAAVLGIVTTSVLTTALKPLVNRRIHDDFLSYPSGHVAAATAAAMVIGLLLADLLRTGRIAGTAILLAVTIIGGGLSAFAQIHLTAHYPTDTLGGFGCGLFVIPPTALVMNRLARRRADRPASK
ncbi:phosphatase PAP2 family protein [Kribbella capetownensis]|uniref:Phosphatase PAP2 family protein n=1 Tax=Kribbella capetownensis TaxID=1572659 RepID=A0A4R0K884_9ACTN|nr:phosphatase PAP2 family protein [Kribbella capetownensis]TCC51345.1 phosphatase PAP2 family protein [Kribbella capetownensis]